MGGRVALEIMRTAAGRVSALALLDTGYQARAGGAAGESEALARQALVQLAGSRGMRAMGEVWVRDMVPPARLADAPLIESILAMVERRTPQVLAAQIRALLARPDAHGRAAGHRLPDAALCGREDTWSPLARHEAMQRLIPRRAPGSDRELRTYGAHGAAGRGRRATGRLAAAHRCRTR